MSNTLSFTEFLDNRNHIVQLEDSLKKCLQQFEKLQLENSCLRKEIDILKKKNSENDKVLNEIKNENRELKKLTNDLNVKYNVINNDFQKLKTQNSDLKNDINHLKQKSCQAITPNKQKQPVTTTSTTTTTVNSDNMATSNGNPWNKYKVVENDLNRINKQFISLDDQERRNCNVQFKQFMDNMVEQMKSTDKLFERIFSSILYAGSFYDGLKVGKPDEFDLDLIMKLPINYLNIVIKTQKNYPGYVRLKVDDTDYKNLVNSPQWSDIYKPMFDWFDSDKHLLPDQFRRWMQSVVQKTFNLRMAKLNAGGFQVRMTTSGPAVTLHLSGITRFDVDLVPVLQMQEPIWPPSPVRAIPAEAKQQKKTSWYCVPKPLKNDNTTTMLYWRLALHEQERVLINGKEKLKPALRCLKKFRDTQQFKKIASYFLKTICLWEIEKTTNNNMWKSAPTSFVFVHLLKCLRDCLQKKCIPYYWQKQNNLLKGIDEKVLENNYNRLKGIIEKIEKDPKEILNFILTKDEKVQFDKGN